MSEWDAFPDATTGATALASFDQFPDAEQKQVDPFAHFPDVTDSAAQDGPQTAADLMSSRFTDEQKRAAMKRGLKIPTMSEVGVVPKDAMAALVKYTTPLGFAQQAATAIAPDSTAAKVTSGVVSGIGEALSGFTTPESLSALAVMPASKIGQVLLNLGFGAKAVSDLPDQIKAYGATNDPEEKARIATNIAVSVGLPTVGLTHAVTRGPIREATPELRGNTGPIPESVAQPTNVQDVLASETARVAPESLSAAETLLSAEQQSPVVAPDIRSQESPQTETSIPVEPAQAPSVPPFSEKEMYDNLKAAGLGEKDAQRVINEYKRSVSESDTQIADSLSKIKEANPELFNQDVQNAPEQTSTTQPEPIGMAKRFVQEDIARGALPPEALVSGVGWTPEEAIAKGRELINKGVDPKTVVDAIKGNKRFPVGVRDAGEAVAVLHAERERLGAERAAAQQAAMENPQNPELQRAARSAESNELQFLRESKPHAGGLAQRIMVAFQEARPVDLSTFDGLYRKAIEYGNGRELLPAQKAELVRRSNKAKFAKRAESKALDNLQQEIDRTLPKRGVPTEQEIAAEVEKMVQELTPCL